MTIDFLNVQALLILLINSSFGSYLLLVSLEVFMFIIMPCINNVLFFSF